MSALFDRTGILRASDFGPDDDGGDAAAMATRERENAEAEANGATLVYCCSRGCWRCVGTGWLLPALPPKRWDDGGASECVDQMEIPF